MKKTFLILSLALGLVYCKTKKESVKPAPAGAKTPIDIAVVKWPNTAQSELDEGKLIYETKCNTCHGLKKIVTRSEKNWIHEIDDMSPKAKLTAEEKLKLTKYILSYREAYTTTN